MENPVINETSAPSSINKPAFRVFLNNTSINPKIKITGEAKIRKIPSSSSGEV